MRQAKIRGRKRKYTDAQVEAVRRWDPRTGKSLAQLCRENGVNPACSTRVRTWVYKTPSPQ